MGPGLKAPSRRIADAEHDFAAIGVVVRKTFRMSRMLSFSCAVPLILRIVYRHVPCRNWRFVRQAKLKPSGLVINSITHRRKRETRFGTGRQRGAITWPGKQGFPQGKPTGTITDL
jgi:hypothetical protein